MINFIITSFKRLKYLLFRYLYTTTHLLAFTLLGRRWDRSAGEGDKPYILVCGAEYTGPSSTEKLILFGRWLKASYPDKTPILLSKKIHRDSESEGEWMRQVPWEWQTRARLLHPALALVFRKAPLIDERRIRHIARQAGAMYDLGSRQISSDISTGWTANALANMIFARRFGIKHIMAPQLFGPFSYHPPLLNRVYRAMIKKILPYACLIGAADGESYRRISRYSEKAVLCADFGDFLALSRRFIP
jgi:hypothetical protein